MIQKDLNRIKNMIRLKETGFSYQQIGETFGLSRQRVHQILTNYNTQGSSTLYQQLRQLVLDRDNNKCILCGNSENLQVHHIDNNPNNNKINNLITVCPSCHQLNHFQGKLKANKTQLTKNKWNRILDKIMAKYNLKSNEEIANFLELDTSTIYYYREGKRIPSGRVIEKLLNLGGELWIEV